MAGVGRGGMFHTFSLTCIRLAVAAPGVLRFLSELNHLEGGSGGNLRSDASNMTTGIYVRGS